MDRIILLLCQYFLISPVVMYVYEDQSEYGDPPVRLQDYTYNGGNTGYSYDYMYDGHDIPADFPRSESSIRDQTIIEDDSTDISTEGGLQTDPNSIPNAAPASMRPLMADSIYGFLVFCHITKRYI